MANKIVTIATIKKSGGSLPNSVAKTKVNITTVLPGARGEGSQVDTRSLQWGSVSLSLSLSLSLPPSPSLSPLPLSLSLSLSPSLSPSPSLSLSHTHSLSLTHTLSLSLSLTHTHSLSHSLSFSFSLSLSLSLSHTEIYNGIITHIHIHTCIYRFWHVFCFVFLNNFTKHKSYVLNNRNWLPTERVIYNKSMYGP